MLKALMLKRKIDAAEKSLASLRETLKGFTTREAELAKAITEASTEEERTTVEEEVENFENQSAEARAEETKLVGEIEELENELRDLENNEPQPEPAPAPEPIDNNRGGNNVMNTRTQFFGRTVSERNAFIENENVKTFLERVREFKGQKRAVTGAELAIPEQVVEIVKEQVEATSKLYKHINAKPVAGTTRQIVMGTIPEAVWTEAVKSLSELSFAFNDVEVDGYKVGGFVAIANSTLEDSDIALATEIIQGLGQAIGFALDKAVLYGTGTKMPLGAMTRLAQAEAPAQYPTTARPWEKLSETNIVSIAAAKTGVAFFKELVKASGAAKGKYSNGAKVWAMNEATKTALMGEALSINAAGAIATGIGDTMPVIGGAIETLSFMPDNVIIGGYGDLYYLAERTGTKIASSDLPKFIDDQTVFKGTARYDGIPTIAEGFVAIGINGVTPDATMTFASVQ